MDAILVTGQGLFPDKVFHTSWQNSKKAGLLRGCYWFYDSRATPKSQAELWISALDWRLGGSAMRPQIESHSGVIE